MIAVIILSVSFFLYKRHLYKEKNIIGIANINESDITKLVLRGHICDDKVVYKDKKQISKFLELMGNDIVKGEKQPKGNNGWADQIEIYSNEKLLISITSSINDFFINGKWYKIVDGDFNEYDINGLLDNGRTKK